MLHKHKRLLACAALAAAASVALTACGNGGPAASGVQADCFNRTSSSIGGPFNLTAHTGATMTDADFRGGMTLVFFGFTFCPDVCPDTLYRIGTAINQLPESVPAPRTVLISIDPQRDTPEALGRYIASNGFPSDIVGLTGPEEELRKVSTAFAAPFERVGVDDGGSDYLMNHSSILYLMDADWKLATYFSAGTPPADIAACIAAIHERAG
jgi:protein SCO1/2